MGDLNASTMNEARPFNSALETGLRGLTLLVECYPSSLDLQRLLLFDYLLVHSEDAGGPPSIHPPTPHRSGEILVRRGIVEKGVLLMMSRRLVERHVTPQGFSYAASEYAAPFLDSLEADYTLRLREYAVWVTITFGPYSDQSLMEYFRENLDRWGGEFETSHIAGELVQ
ncbi:MAG: threonine transporter [Alphaproteobacteria bacterium]|nr:MAG: threonine transporter [Alphaproteobacteria bacterium]